MLALAYTPVRPKKNCKSCHEPDVYQDLLEQLDRKVGLPKLVLTSDFAADRCLENVVSLRVVEPVDIPQGPRPKTLYSPTISLVGADGKEQTLDKLPALPRTTVLVNQVGEGKGYHGRPQYSGVALAELLEHFKISGDDQSALVVSAPDGYASLVSWGELYRGPWGGASWSPTRSTASPLRTTGASRLSCPTIFGRTAGSRPPRRSKWCAWPRVPA